MPPGNRRPEPTDSADIAHPHDNARKAQRRRTQSPKNWEPGHEYDVSEDGDAEGRRHRERR